MTKVNPNNRNETKSDIFPYDIFKSDNIFFYPKILKYFNDFQNRNFSVLTKVNENIENEKNQAYFHEAYSNLTLFFNDCKILQYLSDLSLPLFNFTAKASTNR